MADYHTTETRTPREQVLSSLKTAILLAFIAIRFDKDPDKTTEQKAQELEDQIVSYVETIVSGIESRGISFVAREDVPKAFLDA
jgi:hypothetical protein